MSPTLITYVIAGLAFVSIVGVGFALTTSGPSQQQQKRFKQVSSRSDRRGSAAIDVRDKRKKEIQDSMKSLRAREEKRRKDVHSKSLPDRIKQAGFSFSPTVFWLVSAGIGVGSGLAAFVAGLQYPVVAGIAFATGLGLPRWFLGMAISARQKKFLLLFADAIDVIVRSVKSGLPLIECLRIIARESPQPLSGEFERVIDSIQMGGTVAESLERMYRRMPLPEVNFFNIVISIQQQAGGNLSEALGNLSIVLRSRKMLKEKVKALSSEAKASAMIIGALPICVMLLVYVTTPEYITELFTHSVGHMILLIGGTLMALGIFIMRQMINFDV